jgi:large subunit ribosomal protein L3
MKFLLAKKVNMTQIFDEAGRTFAVTVLSVTPNKVTQVKNTARDGYSAVQVGMQDKKQERKREYKISGDETPANVGDSLEASIFTEGENVAVTAISKGKGFQGVVKRHGFKGGRRSHGQKHSEREPGSIGGGARAGGRVAKGMRMAGRMGSDRVTVSNLKVIKVSPETNEIFVSGAIPGRRGTLVEIKSQK